MTSDSFGASLVDDSLFSDIFTMQSQTLNDFEFGLEATNIDSLLELFEEQEREKANNEKNNLMAKNFGISNNVTVKQKPKKSKIIKISPLKAKTSSTKKKGISLLAKPKNNVSHVSKSDLQAFSYLLQDHDYCLVYKENQNQLFHNKLPDYITSFNHESCLLNNDNSDYYDKIPNYLKDYYLSNSDSNISNEILSTNDEDILIELNEASIEMSEQFFEDSLSLFDTKDDETNEIEDLISNVSNYFNSESQVSKFEELLNIDKSVPQECEQLKEHNQNEDKQNSIRISRSRSRESLKTYNNNNSSSRIRKMSTRSSVDSLSRSSSSSSCSSCSSCLSFSSRDSDKTNRRFKSSNIVRNDNKEQQYSKKRSLKESYCQKNYKSSTNFKSKYETQNKRFINNVHNKVRNSIVNHTFEKDIEERKIVYVGKIPDGTTKTQLRHWFGKFGAIKEVSIHFRDHGDNYAFVTFLRKSDAYEAIEHANDDSRHPKFDLSFGGRRQFCKTYYEDLDYAEDNSAFNSNMDFDSLLKSTRAKLIS